MRAFWGLVTLVIVTAIITTIYRLPDETIENVSLIITIGAVILVVIILVLFFAMIWQKYRIIRAHANREELQANLIESGSEIWVREVIKYNGTKSIEYARLGGIRLRVNSHDHKPTESEILFATTQQTTGQTKLLASGPMSVVVPSTPLDLLILLDRAERVLIKGASDAGKTELLRHVAQRSGGTFVIDPHFTPGVWPVTDNHIIGAGRNYPAIDEFLSRLMVELNNRYRRRAVGDTNFKPITLIVDEFQSIREECDQAGKILSTLIRESRKVGCRLFIGSHSELVKSLGLDGQGDIREGLLIVRLGFDQITRQRTCRVDDGNGERDCYFPPFGQHQATVQRTPDLVLSPAVTAKETKIIEMIQAGAADKEIAQEVFGKAYLSGDNFYKVKLLREQYLRSD